MSPNLVLQSRLPESLKRPHFICQCPHTAHQVDWKIHKPMCKALSAIEKSNPIAAAILLSTVPSEPTTDVDVLNDISAGKISSILNFCRHSVQSQLTLLQEELVMFEPRCMVW
ncbi:hypothetical protein C8F04DRAFT_1043879 [Mycena alexandri]|uniref:MYND-type domain-containing protein n=1 Tax=Mycena alexandri TaxID=1745969 RepID=A0AAD6WXS7_9AGAR|nr:hypothetical protein C8F04DRAFT_1043879 [Mycena alexandri]